MIDNRMSKGNLDSKVSETEVTVKDQIPFTEQLEKACLLHDKARLR